MMRETKDFRFGVSRRQYLDWCTGGVCSLGLAALIGRGSSNPAMANSQSDPSHKGADLAASADRMIFLFQFGSPSQVDTFDYKPELKRRDGQMLPPSSMTDPNVAKVLSLGSELMASPFAWRRYGESGQWISELFPHLSQHADELCVIRSMVSESNNHAPASLLINTGFLVEGKPSLGSWLTYGLGSENENMPGYVVLMNVGPYSGPANYSSGFLKPTFGGVHFHHEGTPMINLTPPIDRSETQRPTIDLIQHLNRLHRESRLADRASEQLLGSRMESYELAFRMQSQAMGLADLSRESSWTQKMYGLDRPETAEYGRMCLQARRLVESGVRVVQVFNGVATPKEGWDGHRNLKGNHEFNAARTDQPIAALLTDLKLRGLLDRTLIVWCGEFGRMPMWDSGGGRTKADAGRNHNNLGFTMWMAGGGVRRGQSIGSTDDFGLRAVERPCSVHDLHATILKAFGLSANDLTFEVGGRHERLIGVEDGGSVIDGVLG